jgi:hypothetical protein
MIRVTYNIAKVAIPIKSNSFVFISLLELFDFKYILQVPALHDSPVSHFVSVVSAPHLHTPLTVSQTSPVAPAFWLQSVAVTEQPSGSV